MVKDIDLTTLKQLVQSKKWVLVFFYTQWCAACKFFNQTLDDEVLPSLEKYANVEFVKLDIEKSIEAKAWAKECGLITLPNTAVFLNGIQLSFTYRDGRTNTDVVDAKVIRGDLPNIQSIVEKIIQENTP